MKKLNWQFILTVIALIIFWAWVASMCGCCVTSVNYALPTGQTVKAWQGQVLFPSKYKSLKANMPGGVHVEVSEVIRWTEPNVIEAGGTAAGNVIGAAALSAVGRKVP